MSESAWKLTQHQVLECPEISVLIFHNMYPEGRQGGLEIIQHGERIATNGDLRLEPAPGQWSPLPKMEGRSVDAPTMQVAVQMNFTESEIAYTVRVTPQGEGFRVALDLAKPMDEEMALRAGFNLELLPSALFGKTYAMGDTFGTFPHQGNGPTTTRPSGVVLPTPLAHGQRLVVAPEDPLRRLEIESLGSEMVLIDGRNASANGWYVVRSNPKAGVTNGAVEWVITPNRIKGWMREPQILVSQVGYHPDQEKQVLIELDPRTGEAEETALLKITPEGLQAVQTGKPEMRGNFLHYRYAQFDFSAVRAPGMYVVQYGQKVSPPFKIASNVYQEGVWQPTLETFMPVQMCHVRVEDPFTSRVWHGVCHLDDAIQAPTNHVHFDGYQQYGETETSYAPFSHIPGMDRGGWHDAGDYDLATGSQANTTYSFALAYEAFQVDSDQTTVKRDEKLVLLHQPDGTPDLIQQVMHGVDFLLSAYRAAGHSFAGVIEGTIPQYAHLGDSATMTDNRVYDADLPEGTVSGERSAKRDDRWAFTNHNTALEYQVAGALAIASRVLKGFDEAMAAECLGTALGIWEREHTHEPVLQRNAYVPWNPEGTEVMAAVELLLATGEERYAKRLVGLLPVIEKGFQHLGWNAARALPKITDEGFKNALRAAAESYQAKLAKEESESPFRLPFGEGWLRANRPDHDPFAQDYHPPIWGVGWSLQGFAMHHYYLVQAYPDLFHRESVLRVLNYVLGWHPANNLSLVSGVGAQSLTIAYGVNRAEWSYTPGGIASGPALIRPDFIELMDPWPWLWQQKEYVIGGGASYLFLVLAADRLLNG